MWAHKKVNMLCRCVQVSMGLQAVLIRAITCRSCLAFMGSCKSHRSTHTLDRGSRRWVALGTNNMPTGFPSVKLVSMFPFIRSGGMCRLLISNCKEQSRESYVLGRFIGTLSLHKLGWVAMTFHMSAAIGHARLDWPFLQISAQELPILCAVLDASVSGSVS